MDQGRVLDPRANQTSRRLVQRTPAARLGPARLCSVVVMSDHVVLGEVAAGNWRACAALEVADEQEEFVAPVAYYLALCAYGDSPWRPLAVRVRDEVVGFVMWGRDPADGSFWIGGLVIDRRHQ